MRHVVLRLALVFFTVNSIPAFAATGTGTCTTFDDLQLGTTYNVPGSFSSNGTTVTTSAFQWAGGTWTPAGFAEVDDRNLSGGDGYDLEVNNITLGFDFGGTVDGLRMLYRDYGGNINLTINGDFRNIPDLDPLHGQLVGGVLVEVLASPTGFGVLRVTGSVSSFSIGGQELWIDNICVNLTTAACVDFEDLPYPQSYSSGQFFVDSGVVVMLDEFYWTGGQAFTGGSCNVDTDQLAGASGQDVNSNNINLHFDWGVPYRYLSLAWGEYGGNVNLIVNGEVANVTDLLLLDNLTVGGVLVAVISGGGSTGGLELFGPIHSFAIGGQELWIDDVCVEDRAVFADGFEFGNTDRWSSTVP